MEKSKVVFVCGNRLSKGMAGEIVQATALRKPIYVFDADLHCEVQKIVRQKPSSHVFRLLISKTIQLWPHPRPQMEMAFRKKRNGEDFFFLQ